jgi:hypothetical protein
MLEEMSQPYMKADDDDDEDEDENEDEDEATEEFNIDAAKIERRGTALEVATYVTSECGAAAHG